MSSEAITRNDLTAILNEVLPPTPSEYRKLLWTNPNIASNFSGQTISSLDLTPYDEVEISWLYNVNTTTIGGGVRIPIGYSDVMQQVGGTGGSGSGYITVVTRLCTVNSNNIVFSDAYLGYDGQIMSSPFNHNLIPLKIYGIKYERVSIPQEGVPSVHIVKKSLTPTAQAGKASWTVNISDVVPSGATVQSVIISRLPNPNWIYADVLSYSNTQVVIPYNNTYSAAITEPLELGILYTLD